MPVPENDDCYFFSEMHEPGRPPLWRVFVVPKEIKDGFLRLFPDAEPLTPDQASYLGWEHRKLFFCESFNTPWDVRYATSAGPVRMGGILEMRTEDDARESSRKLVRWLVESGRNHQFDLPPDSDYS